MRTLLMRRTKPNAFGLVCEMRMARFSAVMI
jgi:hypothetical protein